MRSTSMWAGDPSRSLSSPAMIPRPCLPIHVPAACTPYLRRAVVGALAAGIGVVVFATVKGLQGGEEPDPEPVASNTKKGGSRQASVIASPAQEEPQTRPKRDANDAPEASAGRTATRSPRQAARAGTLAIEGVAEGTTSLPKPAAPPRVAPLNRPRPQSQRPRPRRRRSTVASAIRRPPDTAPRPAELLVRVELVVIRQLPRRRPRRRVRVRAMSGERDGRRPESRA